MELDLNIQHYTYNDLLQLYDIDTIDKQSLKTAYRTTMMMHPDKSGLPKEYFLFFVKAYRILHNISNKEENCVSTCYDTSTLEKRMEPIAKEYAYRKDFHIWFNKQFDALDIQDEDQQSGYEDWLKENKETKNTIKKISKSEMNTYIETHREKQMIDRKDHGTLMDIGKQGYDLTRKRTLHYDSDIFSTLPYQDLKKAHEETLIPVKPSDGTYYTSLEEYTNARNEMNTNPLLHEINHREEIQANMQRSFELAKRDEYNKSIQKKWWSSMKQLSQ